MLSNVMEDYLKAIYTLEMEQGAPVSTSAVADALDKTPSTATNMLEKLAERGLVDREKYKGVELTPEGERVALEVVRHHRLLETYLIEQLDYTWDEVHEEADALEHHISERFEARVAEMLNDPSVDPHGDPIPGADLEPLDVEETSPLTQFGVGDSVVVSRVNDRDAEELSYLADAGVTPGTEVEIVDVAPFGMVTVRVAESGREQSLPEDVADAIRVRAVAESGDSAEVVRS